MNRLRTPFRIIRANLRPYLVMNAIVYGMCLLGMGLGVLFPELHAARGTQLGEGSATLELVSAVISNVWLFALTILLVNVFSASLLLIVLPSLIIPFAGIVVFAIKALDLGILLAPVDRTSAVTLLPHSLTLLIEFQAYAVVMLGAYLLGRAWIRPGTVGADTRRQGYVRGLRQLGWLGLLALVLLVIGAGYEAFEVIYLVPPLIT